MEIRPDNPLYLGCNIQRVERGQKPSYCLKMKVNQESVELLSGNFLKVFHSTPPDSMPIQLTGSAPTWVYIIVMNLIKNGNPRTIIEYKKGKDKITLLPRKEGNEQAVQDE